MDRVRSKSLRWVRWAVSPALLLGLCVWSARAQESSQGNDAVSFELVRLDPLLRRIGKETGVRFLFAPSLANRRLLFLGERPAKLLPPEQLGRVLHDLLRVYDLDSGPWANALATELVYQPLVSGCAHGMWVGEDRAMAVLQIPEGDASVVKSRAQAGMTDSGTMVAETGDRVLYVTDLAEPLHNLVVQVVARHPRVLVTILRGVRLASDQLKSVAASLEQIMAESPPASPETDPAPYAGVMIAADPEEYVLLLAGPPQKVRDLAEFAHAVDGKSR